MWLGLGPASSLQRLLGIGRPSKASNPETSTHIGVNSAPILSGGPENDVFLMSITKMRTRLLRIQVRFISDPTATSSRLLPMVIPATKCSHSVAADKSAIWRAFSSLLGSNHGWEMPTPRNQRSGKPMELLSQSSVSWHELWSIYPFASAGSSN